MEAVISGQAGVALLVDGDELSSIYAHDVETVIARGAGEFHYLFGGATDLTFVEDVSTEQVRRELVAAADGQDITQLTLLLLAADRPNEIREMAASELRELLAANADAASFAERLLFSTLLPTDANVRGALQYCGAGLAGKYLERVRQMQPFIQRTQEAWRAIPESCFGTSDQDCRKAADAVFVREGVFRAFVVASAGESSLDSVVIRSLQIPAVRSLTNHRDIVTRWKSNLAIENTSSNRDDIEDMLTEDARWEENEGGGLSKERRRRRFDRQKELSRVDRVKASIEDAMRDRDLGKARRFAKDLVKEQVAKSGNAYACKSLCDLAKRAQDLGLHQLQLEFTSGAVELKSDDAWSWAQHGKALLDNGRSMDALTAYDQAAFFSQSAEVSNGRAETLRSLGRVQEALEAYEAVIQAHPENVVAKNGRAETLRSLGRVQEALEAYDAVIQAHPENVVAKSGRAETLRSLGRVQDALEAYEAVIQAHPENVVAKNGRAETLRSLGRVQEALEAYDAVIQAHPENVVAKSGRAETLRSLGRVQDALEAYEAVIQAHPENVVAKNGRAETLRSLGRVQEALEAYEAVIQAHPENVVAKNGRAETLRSLGRVQEALEAYKAVIQAHPENVVAKSGRAETLRSLGRVQEALEAYEAVIQAHPENVVAKNGRAETLRSLGRGQDALEAYEAVIQAHPEDAVAKNGRACALVALKRYDEALETLPAHTPTESANWTGFHIRGTCLLKQGKLAEAVDVFQLGVERCPYLNSRNYFTSALAFARLRQGKIEDAARVLQELESRVESPANAIPLGDSSGPLLVRVHVCGETGRDLEAKNLYQRLPDVLPQDEQDVKDELNYRHILRTGPQHSDDWLFEQLCDCLLAA